MTHDQTFTLRPDGGYDIQPAGVMLEFEGKSYRLKEAAARLAINPETS